MVSDVAQPKTTVVVLNTMVKQESENINTAVRDSIQERQIKTQYYMPQKKDIRIVSEAGQTVNGSGNQIQGKGSNEDGGTDATH